MSDYSYYNEEDYVSRLQLRSIYATSASDLVYQKIKQERKLYYHPLLFEERIYYITLNQSIYFKMLKIYEIDTFRKEKTNSIDINKQLNLYCERNKIALNLRLFLLSNELFLIKVFVLLAIVKNNSLLEYFLEIHNQEHYLLFLNNHYLCQYDKKEEEDLTYYFRNFLAYFYENISNYIQSAKKVNVLSKTYLQTTVNKRYIQFYENHNNQNFYDVSEYQNYFNVSYENARISMNKMCKLGFYYRKKIGKKYVYYPCIPFE